MSWPNIACSRIRARIDFEPATFEDRYWHKLCPAGAAFSITPDDCDDATLCFLHELARRFTTFEIGNQPFLAVRVLRALGAA